MAPAQFAAIVAADPLLRGNATLLARAAQQCARSAAARPCGLRPARARAHGRYFEQHRMQRTTSKPGPAALPRQARGVTASGARRARRAFVRYVALDNDTREVYSAYFADEAFHCPTR
jgi:hypothetical protein